MFVSGFGVKVSRDIAVIDKNVDLDQKSYSIQLSSSTSS